MGYTDTQRTEAVALSVQVGVAEAARQTGVPRRTLSTWRTAAGVAQADAEKTREARAAGAERVSIEWADYRAREATAAGALAAHTRGQIRAAVDQADGRNAQALATVYGILVDKADKLADQATARIEVWAESEVDRELRQALTELEDRARG